MTEVTASPRVAIVGAGPTGLVLANLLGRYGIRSLLVERNPTTVQEPRAVSIDDESLRTIQAAGMVETVLERIVAGYGSTYLGPSGRPFLRVAPKSEMYGYPRRNAFRQPVLEGQLREGLERFDCVESLFGWRLEEFTQDDDGVDLRLAGPDGGERRVQCDYLVGCDGAASLVRTNLGLKLEGETFAEKWLIVDLESSPADRIDTLVFCDPARPCIALPGPNQTRRFEFKLLPGERSETILGDESVQALLSGHGAHPESILRRKTVYTFHARLAPTWKVGRVFLAGDACHLTPPFAGQGMNSGIRDAHNLAWKLAAVLDGRLGRRLLESYEKERRDHVRGMIDLALRMGRIMGPSNRLTAWLTRSAFRCVSIWPAARDYFAEMKFKPKNRVSQGFALPTGSDAEARWVGKLLPQPFGVAHDDTAHRLDDVLGDGFALVVFSNDPASVAAATDQPIWRQLSAIKIAITAPGVAPIGDIAVIAIESGWPEDFPTATDDLVLLVRPDRYIAGAFKLADVAEVAARMTSLCADTWDRPDRPVRRPIGEPARVGQLASPSVAFFQARA